MALQVTNIFREKIFGSHLQRVSSLLHPPSSVHELRNIESLSPHTTFQHSTLLLTHPLTTCSTHHLIYKQHQAPTTNNNATTRNTNQQPATTSNNKQQQST